MVFHRCWRLWPWLVAIGILLPVGGSASADIPGPHHRRYVGPGQREAAQVPTADASLFDTRQKATYAGLLLATLISGGGLMVVFVLRGKGRAAIGVAAIVVVLTIVLATAVAKAPASNSSTAPPLAPRIEGHDGDCPDGPQDCRDLA